MNKKITRFARGTTCGSVTAGDDPDGDANPVTESEPSVIPPAAANPRREICIVPDPFEKY